MGQNGEIELLKLKVFLYKYTPEFTPTSNPGDQQGTLSKIDRFKIDLDESKYFSMYDISEFVASYSFDQTITENTFNWSIVLHDMPIPFSILNKTVKLIGPELSNNATSKNLLNLAQYEAEMGNLTQESSTIAEAKLARGLTEAPMVIKVNSTSTNKPGLRLSDLIQKYDIVSVFLYKDITPLDQLRGLPGPFRTRDNVIFKFSEPRHNSDGTTSYPFGHQLTDADLQRETILLGPGPNYSADPFFSNEFNGFVMTRTVTRALGAVDTVTISGNGITRLFGSTRRIIKSGLMQNSIYKLGEIPNPDAFTAFQNIYAGELIEAMFADLFQTIYRITFVTAPVPSAFDSTGDSTALQYGPPPQPKVSIPGDNFFDLSSLKISNSLQTNLFTIPPFLLAVVMKRRGFSYREPIDLAAQQETLDTVNLQTSISGNGNIDQSNVDKVLNETPNLNPITYLQDPVQFDPELNNLRAYFLQLEEVFRDFNAELRTPFEIINEIKSKTYLEFFERSDGVVIIRQPDYNNVSNIVLSSECGVQEISYTDQAENLVSRHKVAYALDLGIVVSPAKEYAYTDGKLLLQYGMMESGTDANPNVRDTKTDNDALSQTRDSGLFEYAKYFLKIGNASLKTGTAKIDLDSSISVGRTFFDAKNSKFSYIVGVSKNVSPGAPITMTLRLAYVRDAVQGEIGPPQFEYLPTLFDIANKFSKGSSPVVPPTSNPNHLESDGGLSNPLAGIF